jgi:hypothetical protein
VGSNGDDVDEDDGEGSQDDQHAAFQADLDQVFALQPNIDIQEEEDIDSSGSEDDDEPHEHGPINDSLENIEDEESDAHQSSSSEHGHSCRCFSMSFSLRLRR